MKALCASFFSLLMLMGSADELQENIRLKQKVSEQGKKNILMKKENSLLEEKVKVLQEKADRVEGRKSGLSQKSESIEIVRLFSDKVLEKEKKDPKKDGCYKSWRRDMKRGKSYRFSVEIKSEDVVGQHSNPIKFGLMQPLETGGVQWPSAFVGKGTFDWKKVSFTYAVPVDAKAAYLLMLGIEGKATGKVSFRNLLIEEIQ